MEGMAVTASFWRNKKVFITGHTGFKGSWLSLCLQQYGASLCGYALSPPTEPNLFELAKVGNKMVSLTGDVRDSNALYRAIQKHRPEIIFHLAAQALVRRSYQEPVSTFATNVMGTVHLLEAARQTDSVRVIVIVTSDKCYENNELSRGYRETDPMGGFDPYSCSKGCAELITAAYRNSYFSSSSSDQSGAAVATVRAGNVIGGGDWAEDRLIPDAVRSILANKPVLIRNPDAIRPWQHVLEPLNGYLLLAEKLWENGKEYSGGWNFGPSDDDTVPVGLLTRRIIDLWGNEAQWVCDQGKHPHEANYLSLDCSKARLKLGWQPVLTLDETIQWIVEWYRVYAQKQEMQPITLQQIERFRQLRNECQ
ncbi:MAG: CDP-glucose 4,6-dehydratase [Thermincola sp.]|jgi:CDP-glucose 4,6-dehydratase|nr:CDP-glucose 4,6-dehydratase [Thermincola sp.]MDT3701661.1 CDP-glucose 4,6-dehydratase [Thermincola sp.]